MATATNKSAARKAGLLDNPYLAKAAIGEGHIVSHGAAEGEAVLPASNVDTKIAGVCLAGGQAGTTLTSGTDMFGAQWHGRAKAKLKAGLTANRGDMAVPSDSTGASQARTLFSFSQYVLGTYPQTKTAGSNDDFIEVDMAPRLVELVRSVTAGTSSTFGADTKYIAPGYVARTSAQVPLYVVGFTGETLRNLRCTLATAPGGTDTVAFTVQKSSDQGGTWADTTVTCTITGTGKTATDLTHSVSLTQYDMLALKTVSSATTAAIAFCTFDVS